MTMAQELSVGEVARRSGLAVSTLHFYESKGLIASRRTGGNQRRYMRGVLRRIAVIRIAQRAGIPLEEIKQTFAAIPLDRAPTMREWERAMRAWTEALQQRISDLTDLRDKLFSCIGCGCLSLKRCKLTNPEDRAGRNGPGARRWLGDKPPTDIE